MTEPTNLAGRVRFAHAGSTPETLRLLENAFRVPLGPARQEGDEEYWSVIALGLRIVVEIRRREGEVEGVVACRTDDRCYAVPAATLHLEDHLIRLLACEGITAEPFTG